MRGGLFLFLGLNLLLLLHDRLGRIAQLPVIEIPHEGIKVGVGSVR